MINWYSRISTDISCIPDAILWYEEQMEDARIECALKGNLEKNASNLPGVVEKRFGQLQEIEAILEYLNIELRRTRSKYFALLRNKWLGILKGIDMKQWQITNITKLRVAGMEDASL
jgi:hypothetical protein